MNHLNFDVHALLHGRLRLLRRSLITSQLVSLPLRTSFCGSAQATTESVHATCALTLAYLIRRYRAHEKARVAYAAAKALLRDVSGQWSMSGRWSSPGKPKAD